MHHMRPGNGHTRMSALASLPSISTASVSQLLETMERGRRGHSVVFCSLLLLSSLQAQECNVLFKRNLLEGFSRMPALKSQTVHSLAQCALACAGRPDCKSVSFQSGHQNCSLYSALITALDIIPVNTGLKEKFFTSTRSGPCPQEKGYAIVDGTQKCLRLERSKKTWPEAQAHCQEEGGHLAIVEDQTTWNAMRTHLEGLSPDEDDLFVGGFMADTGYWTWMDGTTVQGNLWCPGEPNNEATDEWCLALLWEKRFNDHMLLNDIPCRYSRFFVCEL